jgi:hypothetical protein
MKPPSDESGERLLLFCGPLDFLPDSFYAVEMDGRFWKGLLLKGRDACILQYVNKPGGLPYSWGLPALWAAIFGGVDKHEP